MAAVISSGALDNDRCAAFPDGIPDPIWLGEDDHSEPFDGDGGVRRAPLTPINGASPVELRHAAWTRRTIERLAHADDPLGAIILAFDRASMSDVANDAATVPPDSNALRAAWRATHDAPAVLLVLLRTGRTEELARAIRHTSQQLAAEECDYLDDKGWLGVGLTLASYETEESLEAGPAAWSALSSPFGSAYLTGRFQQILLRAIRRIVPDVPAASAWTGAAHSAIALGDGAPAYRLAPETSLLRIEDAQLLEPWTAVTSARDLETELARELVPGHRLYGRKLRAVARRSGGDDVLFVDDTVAAVVHLTWAKESDPTFPSAEIFPSIEEWVVRRMQPDHQALAVPSAGASLRALAFEFRSALTLEAMLDKLPDKARWEWTLRDSHWYGDYLWAKDSATKVRIFKEDDPEKFTIQAEIVEGADPGDDWFASTSALATETFLPAIEATEIVAAAPEYD